MVLVTGGTGLLGARLLFDLIKSGEDVVAIKRPAGNLTVVKGIFNYYEKNAGDELFSKIQWKEGDVLDLYSLMDAIEPGAEVYHCAAMISFNTKAREKMMKANVEGTANVVNVCLEKKAKKLCYASSVAAIGSAKEGELADEKVRWKSSLGKSNYSISKFAAEKEVWRGIAEGLDAVIVNPSIIIGPGNWKKSSARLFLDVWKGMKFYTSGINGFVDVRDVSKIMIRLLKSGISGERFLLNSANLPFKAVLDSIAGALQKPAPSIKMPPGFTEVFWRIEKLRAMLTRSKPIITKEIAREASSKHYYSANKVKEALGLEFITIEQSIKDTALVFLEQAQRLKN